MGAGHARIRRDFCEAVYSLEKVAILSEPRSRTTYHEERMQSDDSPGALMYQLGNISLKVVDKPLPQFEYLCQFHMFIQEFSIYQKLKFQSMMPMFVPLKLFK